MQTAKSVLVASLVLASPAVLWLFAADQNVTARVNAEIHRIEEAGKKAPSDPALAGTVSAAQNSLKSAGDALKSEQLYLALERLVQATDLSEGVGELARMGGMVTDMAAFEAE